MSQTRYVRFSLVVCLLALLVPMSMLGQSSSGSISGTVADETGAVLPGVTVTATNVATGVNRMTVSNAVGHYQIGLLPPGTYRVAAELSGFQPAKLDRVVVNVGTDVDLHLKLRAGLAETVTVTASAPIVETTKSEVSSVVNQTAIENLPTNGRNFIDFVLTTPGVVKDPRSGDISFAGQRGTLNSLVVDGANNDNTFFGQTVGRTGSGRAPYQFSQDAVKEFQVNANAYSAEYGRAGGAVINVVTKSGTNEFHGSAFNYYRDRRLNANDYINVINKRAKSAYHYDQYGISLGGPIVRDKHFFFANWDRQRNSVPNVVVLGGGRITDFPTDAASQAALSILQAKGQDWNRQQNQDVYLLKTDHDFVANQHFSLRYNRQRFTGVNFENASITMSDEHTGNSNVFTDSFSGVYDFTGGGSFFNEVRAQYLKDREPGQANSSDPEATILQGGNTVLIIGRNTFSPRETTIKRYQIADTATYLLMNHTLKAGFDYNKDNILNFFPGNFYGAYRFQSLADFANKKPDRYIQAFPGPGTTGPETHPDLKETGLFVQDEWHVSPALTLNLGLRYDKQDIAQPSVLNTDAQLNAAGYRTDRIKIDNDNFGPRLGIAWTPGKSNRTVLRAGYGIFYGRTPSIMIGTAHSNNGINVQTITFTGSAVPVYPAVFATPPTGGSVSNPTIFVFDPDFENPKVTQSNVGVEQQIGNDFSVGVTYQYVQGSDLPRARDVNLSTPTTETAAISTGGNVSFTRYTGRPFANFSRVIAFESSAKSKYNGVTVDFQRRFANNWQARLAWTHATVKDDKPDATVVVPGVDDGRIVSDPLNIARDYTYGEADVRDRIVLSGVWALGNYAAGLENPLLRVLGSGWTISGIASYQSGQPYTPTVSADLNNDRNSANDVAPDEARSSRRLPSQISVDPRITRDISIFGRAKLQLIAEAFNVLNRSNVSALNTAKYSYNATTKVLTPVANYGTPRTSAGPRIVQLAAKVTF